MTSSTWFIILTVIATIQPSLQTECPPDDTEGTWVTPGNGICYYIHKGMVNFFDALRSCALHGAYLTTIHNGMENAYLVQAFLDTPSPANPCPVGSGYANSNKSGNNNSNGLLKSNNITLTSSSCQTNFWIGSVRHDGKTGSAGTNSFQWTNGADFTYSNWDLDHGQPDNANGQESCTVVYTSVNEAKFKWNDLPCHCGISEGSTFYLGFICKRAIL